MTYVISDIRGKTEKFEKILRDINFGDRDVMYVLGNTLDGGDDPIGLLCDLSMRYNVISVVGDRELMAVTLLSEFDKILKSGSSPDPEFVSKLSVWIRKGGAKTLEGFKALDDDMKEGILEYLEELSLYEEAEVKGKRYIMVHAGFADFDPETPLDDYMPEDLVRTSLDPDRVYFDDATVIVGHTPTSKIEGAEAGKIFYGEGSIFINCGETLGCLRLEDGKEFYA